VKLRQMATLVFATFQPPPQLSATKGMPTTTACQTRVLETSRVSDVCKALAVPREAAKGTATASPTTQLAGARAMRSMHKRGWKAHGTRKEEWAPLPPAEEPGRGRGGRWRRWRGRRQRERSRRVGRRRQRGRAWPWRRLSGHGAHGSLGAAARRRDGSTGVRRGRLFDARPSLFDARPLLLFLLFDARPLFTFPTATFLRWTDRSVGG
jgi:hypothetical protein